MFSNDKALSSIMGWNWITTCNYLGITTGKNVTFKMHNENLVSQVKFKLAWILTRKHLISATFYLYWIGIDQNLFTSLLSALLLFHWYTSSFLYFPHNVSLMINYFHKWRWFLYFSYIFLQNDFFLCMGTKTLFECRFQEWSTDDLKLSELVVMVESIVKHREHSFLGQCGVS